MDISGFSFFLFSFNLSFSFLLLTSSSFSLPFAHSVSLSFLFSGSVLHAFPPFGSFSRSLPFTLSVSYSLSSGQFPIFMPIRFAQFPFSILCFAPRQIFSSLFPITLKCCVLFFPTFYVFFRSLANFQCQFFHQFQKLKPYFSLHFQFLCPKFLLFQILRPCLF